MSAITPRAVAILSALLLGCSSDNSGGDPSSPDLSSAPPAGQDGGARDLAALPDQADPVLPPAEGKALWARGYSVQVKDTAAGTDGAVYLTGSYSRVDFGPGGGGLMNSAGPSDVFVLKFDKVGALLWARVFGRASSDVPTRIAVDKDGNVAIVGYSLRTADTSTHDAFVAVYATSGAQRFYRTYGGTTITAVDTATAVGFAADGGLWVAGGFEDRIDLGGGVLVSAGSRDMYLMNLSAAGAHLLSRRFGSTGYDQATGLAITPDGDVVAVVTGSHSIDFGDGNSGNDPKVDTALVRFGPNGVARWSKRFAMKPYSTCTVAAGADGTLWFLGDLSGAVDFGGGLRMPASGRGIFWARYAGSGAHLSSYVLPSSSGIYLTHGAVDSTGHLVVGGRAEGDINFGAGLTTRTDGLAFLFKSSAGGQIRWARRFGGMNSDEVVGAAILPEDRIAAAANLSKATLLDTVSLPSGGGVVTLTP